MPIWASTTSAALSCYSATKGLRTHSRSDGCLSCGPSASPKKHSIPLARHRPHTIPQMLDITLLRTKAAGPHNLVLAKSDPSVKSQRSPLLDHDRPGPTPTLALLQTPPSAPISLKAIDSGDCTEIQSLPQLEEHIVGVSSKLHPEHTRKRKHANIAWKRKIMREEGMPSLNVN